MSEHSTPEERTEMPTDRRMGQIRKEGALHMSDEVVKVVSLLTGYYMLQFMLGWLTSAMKQIMRHVFGQIAIHEPMDVFDIQREIAGILRLIFPPVAAICVTTAVMAALAVFFQTNFNVKPKWIDIKFDKLNPVGGIKRIFSIGGVVNTLKSIFKLALILPLGYFALKMFSPRMIGLIHESIPAIATFMKEALGVLFWRIMYILIAMAIFDYFWGRYQWLRKNKMTKEEVKDERKSIEGDEQTKRKIQAKGLQRIMQRIQDSIPQADVVITNPTHFAVALKYDRETMSAPTVIAKGKGFLALRIRKLAKESGVPVLERKLLARALFRSTEVGSQIPGELFRAVAEVLAYVYRLRGTRIQSTNRGAPRA